ncbi:hypothetical protein HPY42_02895 [Coprothermobacteraceae bacterium]|nr:hypothetical protein [Coprothermobacteraceae bacterium]
MVTDLHVELVKEIRELNKVRDWNAFLEGAEEFVQGLEDEFPEDELYFSAEMRIYSGMKVGDLVLASTLYDVAPDEVERVVLRLQEWASQNGFTVGEVSLEMPSEAAVELDLQGLIARSGVRLVMEKGKVGVALVPASLDNFSAVLHQITSALKGQVY